MIRGENNPFNMSDRKKFPLLTVGIIIVFLFIFGSCSSRPKKIDSPTVSQADNLYRMGKQFSLNQDYHNAIRSYDLALKRYMLVDNLEGIVLSKIATIGALAQIRDHETIHVKTTELEGFIETNAPEYNSHLILMKTEVAFLANNFYRVDLLTKGFSCDEVVIESQVLSYRLIARVYEGHSAESEYRRLKRNARSLRRAYRRRKIQEIGVYSYVKYVMGFYQVSRENWDQAEEYFRKSLVVDREIDYPYGIAKNLYYLAVVYHKKGNLDLAEPYYKRALNIFKLLEDQIKIDMVRDSLVKLAEQKKEGFHE